MKISWWCDNPCSLWGQVPTKNKYPQLISRVFFARSISWSQKWCQTLLGGEISCSQWEGPSMHSRCLAFFFLSLGREGFFFHFSLVPNVFSLCSFQVRSEISLGSSSSHCVPQHAFHSTSLLSHMLRQMFSSFHLYRWAKGEALYTSK